jgi:pilus assembly protein CpaC
MISQAGRVAEIFAPKKVVNFLKLGEARPQQVLLQVQVAEAARLALKELGFSFFANGSSFQGGAWPGATFLPGISPIGSSASLLSPEFLFSDMSTFFLATGARDFFTIVRMLEEKDLLRTLAKPNLVTVSGKEARFLSGGEFPFPVPQGSSIGGSTVTIEFKPFGVQLGFTPVVREDQTISIRINPEVSSLDFSQGLKIQGFTVPVIRSNKAGTSIELKDGESFAIAGLINNEVRQQVAKIPFLGDIPILGALFRSTKFVNNETELLFLVTVKLVKPFPAGGSPDPRRHLELL